MQNKRKETKYIVICCSNTSISKDWGSKEMDIEGRKEGLLECGFHKIIKRDGTVEDGRDIDSAGGFLHYEMNRAKHKPTNKNSIGVVLIGGGTDAGQSDCNYTLEQFKSLKRLTDELKMEFPFVIEIIGHRDIFHTTEPHFNVIELLK
jgi:N-acetylmuramoyl-L-alanine amidase